MSAPESIRLLTFPFAGGNKYSYQPWEAHADPRIEMMHFEGPGRGDRFRETRLEDMEDVVEDYWRQINGFLDRPFALYGHSMGGMVSFLLTKRIVAEGYRAPEHVFISGRVPPTWQDEGDQLWQRDKAGFWEGIKAYGGSPEALLQHPDLMDLYEPMIRSDLKALYSYNHNDTSKIEPPVTVLLGSREKVTMQSAKDWQLECTKPIQVKQFEGNHFWILNHVPAIMKVIKEAVFPT